MSDARFTTVRDRDVEVVVVRGEIDLQSSPQLKAIAHKVIAARQALVVDLSETTFVDSTALGVLVSVHRAARAAAVPFGIVATEGDVSRILEITGLDRIFALYRDRSSATRQVRSAGAAT